MTTDHVHRTLLTLLGSQHAPDTRLAALRILLRRKAPADVWIQGEPDIVDLASHYDHPDYRHLDVLATVACTPLASVRFGLEKMAETANSRAERLPILTVLANAGETHAANELVAYFSDHPEADLARALATVPVDLADYEARRLASSVDALNASDPDEGAAAVWGAIALARQGRDDSLGKTLDKLKAGWTPALFDGNPMAVRRSIASTAWGSLRLKQFAVTRIGQLPDTERKAIDSETHLGQPHLLLLDSLKAYDAVTEWRTPVAPDAAVDRVNEVLGSRLAGLGNRGTSAVREAVNNSRFGDALPAALRALTSDATALASGTSYEVGNGLVSLVENLPPHDPDGAGVIQAYAALCSAAGDLFPDLEQQLGWALAQGDIDALLGRCCSLMASDDAAVARAASALLGYAVDYRDRTYGPQFGAGAPAGDADWTPIGATDDALITTAWFRDRMPEEEQASTVRGTPDDGATRSAPPPDDDDFEMLGPDGEEPADAAKKRAYAKLDCPSAVVPEEWFDVTVGLSPRPSPGTTGSALLMPDTVGNTFDLTVHLIADGFRVHDNDQLHVTLKVTPERRYPETVVRLAALDTDEFGPQRILMAQFVVAGQMIGAAARTVTVDASAGDDEAPATAEGVDMVVPPRAEAPDLTITITKGNTLRADRLIWSLETPHAELDVTTPAEETAVISDLGEEPGKWSRNLMNQVHLHARSQSNLSFLLRGTGMAIRAKMPLWVRTCLYRLSIMPGEPKSILLVSNEPNVPWELAWLELGEGGEDENFFGAEFSVGRWVIGTASAVTGKVKPPYPPPTQLDVKRMAVVSGDYSATRGWKDLAGAHEEAAALKERYGAESVAADEHLATWLDTAEGFDLVHFAVHGKSDITGSNGGIALTDGKMLTPAIIAGLKLKGAPFIFLNACQLGQGEQTLAEYGGVAAAFLEAGAGGVIAALWNVDDAAARELALNFYSNGAELETGASRFIRDVRAQFSEPMPDDHPAARAPSLLLAYQFFGHPLMRLDLNFPTPDTHTDTEV